MMKPVLLLCSSITSLLSIELIGQGAVDAFILRPQHHEMLNHRCQFRSGCAPSPATRTFLFRRGDKDKENDDDNESRKGSPFPFFAGLGRKEKEATSTANQENKVGSSESATTTTSTTVITTASAVRQSIPAAPATPEEVAAKLRQEAEKARLEAERMDAELTLRKIERLERELAHAQKIKSGDRVEEIQKEMQALEAKLRGETVPMVPKKVSSPSTTPTSRPLPPPEAAAPPPSSSIDGTIPGRLSDVIVPPSTESLEESMKVVEDAPSFVRKALATQLELDFDTADDINTTELAIRLDKMNRLDFSYSHLPRPKFTLEQIQDRVNSLQKDSWMKSIMSPTLLSAAGSNETELALLSLEYEYYIGASRELGEDEFSKIASDEEWLQPVLQALNKTLVDGTIETLYPKCTRKERNGQDLVPTVAQVQQLISDILPKAKFQANSKPERVAGGYVIRGVSKAKDGNELIDSIDKFLSKSPLADKMSVLYTNDFTIYAEGDIDSPGFDPESEPPILYVMGPDVVREPRPFQLSLVSALGVGTSWYLSIYPFLLNPAIAKRVDEALALADANMQANLNWLTDLSLPLFTTFIGIQLVHELGHLVVAGANGIKTTVPTFVPSIITGITSSVTTFKSLPKNKEAMFDFAAAGPLAGMLASLAAIAVGSALSISGDPSNFPALPLEILRQSTLGGGIINYILGNGALSVPEGALGTSAVAGMNIPLHPIAIAGYISLVVNALCVLPVGTTDGGRIALALFGREAKLIVGNLFLFALLLVGLVGSDLFLFYFAFCIAFQTGNEVPARNEVDKISFPRVGVAIATYALAVMSLVPFQ